MTVERNWVFGEAPLPTVVELAGALRELTDTVQSLEESSPELETLVRTVRDAQRTLLAGLIPAYGSALKIGNTSFRPVEAQGRAQSKRARLGG